MAVFCSVSRVNITLTNSIIGSLRKVGISLLQIIGLVGNISEEEKSKQSRKVETKRLGISNLVSDSSDSSKEESLVSNEQKSILVSLIKLYENQKKISKMLNCTT
jgi:hypothetical protein